MFGQTSARNLDSTQENQVNQAAPVKKCKTVDAPPKKWKNVKSNKHDVSEITTGLKALAHTSTTQHHMIMEAEGETEERAWPFAKKNQRKPRTRASYCRDTFMQSLAVSNGTVDTRTSHKLNWITVSFMSHANLFFKYKHKKRNYSIPTTR